MLNPGALGDVFERAVAAVVVQPMTRAPVDGRVGDRPAVDQEDVHPPVTVVVEEHRARPHGLDEMFLGAGAVGMVKRDARLARDVDELRKGSVRAGHDRDTRQTATADPRRCDSEAGSPALPP